MSEQKDFTLDKVIVYTTGALGLDLVVGYLLTGRPLHESFGIELSYGVQQAEYLLFGGGVIYNLLKNYHLKKK